MNIRINKESNTLYVKLSENRVIGIELLNISDHVSLDAVETQLSPQQ